MEGYFRLSKERKARLQRKMWQRLCVLAEVEEITVTELTERAINEAESQEDYELCQLLRDTAEKYNLLWDGI